MLRKYRPVILIVIPFLVLVLYKALSSDRFKPETEKRIELSAGESNLIAVENIPSIQGEKLIINLGSGTDIPGSIGNEQVSIPPGSILDEGNLKLFKGSRKILLWSGDAGVAARAWMLLSQMGFENIYILTDSRKDELFKYEFRPDSTSAAGILND